MKDEGFRQRTDDIEDRTNDGPVTAAARNVIGGVKGGLHALGNRIARGDEQFDEEPEPSSLGDDAGMKDLDYKRGGEPLMYADGGAIPTDDGDDSEPDGDQDDGTPQDATTQSVNKALQAVDAALMYGRKKHGLPTGDDDSGGDSASDDGALAFAEGGAVPDENELAFYGQDRADTPIDMDERLGSLQTPPDDNSDNSGALPVAGQPDDNSGALPVDDGQQAQPQQATPTPLAYLMGADGVAPEVLDQYKQGTTGTEGDRNLAAVSNAYDDQGEQGAYGVVQAMRRKFDLFMNHGRAAVDKGDYAAAAQSATQAMHNLPDGNNVTFAPTQDGLVAQIQAAGGVPQTVPLSKQAADAFLNTGKTGQFDGLLEQGVQNALGQVSRGTGYAGNGKDALSKINSRASSQVQAVTGGRPAPDTQGTDRSVTMGHDDTLLKASPQYRRENPNGAPGPKDGVVQTLPGPNTRVDKVAARNDSRSDARMELEKFKQAALDKRATGRTDQMAERERVRAATEHEKLQQKIDNMNLSHTDRVSRQRLDAASRRMNNINAAIAKGGDEDVQGAMRDMQQLQRELGQGAQPQQGGGNAPAAGGAQPQRQLSPQDEQALQWANQNASDPRAAKIRQHLGVQ